MATTAKTTDLGQGKHEAEADFHGHAPYPSREDLETRLAAARGQTPQAAEVLPVAPAPDSPS